MNKIAGFLAILLAVVAPAVSFAASSDWEDLGGGKARLVAELDPATGIISGVVEFALEDGWKTYWREPGGSGIPPEFDFTGSRLFTPGEVKFPVPRHITLENAEFAGYRGRVLFPFEGSALSLDQAGRIHLSMIAGVCAEVCIPATAEFEIPFAKLMGSDSEAVMVIEDAKASLPAGPHDGLRVIALARDGDAALTVTAEVAQDAPAAELFAEGPAGWNLRPASLVSRDGNTASFRIDLSELDPNLAIGGSLLRLTLGDGASGVEQEMKIGN
ncbi:MAG: protein-disulfide reductase DsbD family protein [Nitratireductor sp.]